MKRVLLGVLGLAFLACTTVHRERGMPAGTGPLVVVYKATIDEGGGVVHRARLAVWAEEPDRLHAELIAPVGGVRFTVDAGGGQVCVVDLDEATAYVGDDAPGAFEALFGVRLAVAEAVAALFRGVEAGTLTVTRSNDPEGTLPKELRIADGARSIALARLRFERGSADVHTLGTGRPPERLRVVPISDLTREER